MSTRMARDGEPSSRRLLASQSRGARDQAVWKETFEPNGIRRGLALGRASR